MAFSDLLCHMARSPALAVTVLLTLAVLVVNGWTDAPNAIAGVVVSGALLCGYGMTALMTDWSKK